MAKSTKKKPKKPKPFNHKSILPWYRTEKSGPAPQAGDVGLWLREAVQIRPAGKWPAQWFQPLFLKRKSPASLDTE